jgi:hypothetical protein
VEGHQGKRLAIECDGDQYHGPDKWMDDIGRQRVLERAGWKFWRCWGSSFARDQAGCLDDLIRTLAKEGIDPVGQNELDFNGFVEFREIGALGEKDLQVENADYTADEPSSGFAQSKSSFDPVLESFPTTVPGIPRSKFRIYRLGLRRTPHTRKETRAPQFRLVMLCGIRYPTEPESARSTS